MISWKKHKGMFGRLFAILVSMSYLLASTPIHQHKDHTHIYNDVAHTSEIHQTDSCHNYIYHGKTSSGCDDHHHATHHELECLICHHFVAGQKLLTPHAVKVAVDFNEEQTPVYTLDIHYIYSGFSIPLRGPPTIA